MQRIALAHILTELDLLPCNDGMPDALHLTNLRVVCRDMLESIYTICERIWRSTKGIRLSDRYAIYNCAAIQYIIAKGSKLRAPSVDSGEDAVRQKSLTIPWYLLDHRKRLSRLRFASNELNQAMPELSLTEVRYCGGILNVWPDAMLSTHVTERIAAPRSRTRFVYDETVFILHSGLSTEQAREGSWRFRIDSNPFVFIEFDRCTFECEYLHERKSYLTPDSNVHVNCTGYSHGRAILVCSLYASPEHSRSETPNVFGSQNEPVTEVFHLHPDATQRCRVMHQKDTPALPRLAFNNCQIVTWNQRRLYYARQRRERCEWLVGCANGLYGRVERSLRMFTDMVHNCHEDYDLLAYCYNVCRLMPAMRDPPLFHTDRKKEHSVISDLCKTMAKLRFYTTPNAIRLKQQLRGLMGLDESNDTAACPRVEAFVASFNVAALRRHGGTAYTDPRGLSRALNAAVWKCLYVLLRAHEGCPGLFETPSTEFECPELRSIVLSLRRLLSPDERQYWCLWNALLCPERLQKHFQIDCHN